MLCTILLAYTGDCGEEKNSASAISRDKKTNSRFKHYE